MNLGHVTFIGRVKHTVFTFSLLISLHIIVVIDAAIFVSNIFFLPYTI